MPHPHPPAAPAPTYLIDPVRVEDTQATALAAHTLLCNVAQVAVALELRDTLVDRLAVHDTLH